MKTNSLDIIIIIIIILPTTNNKIIVTHNKMTKTLLKIKIKYKSKN